MTAAQSMARGVSLVLCVMCGAGAIVSPRAVGQCTLLVRESFRPGERPHGNNGRLRDALGRIADGFDGCILANHPFVQFFFKV